MFGHIYFTVVFHLSPVVRGPACSFIRFLYCNRDVSDDNLNCARDTRKKTGGGSGDGTTCEARDRVGSSHLMFITVFIMFNLTKNIQAFPPVRPASLAPCPHSLS